MKQFQARYVKNKAVSVFQALGWINPIGEHIDYNGFSVIPAVISFSATFNRKMEGETKHPLS
jgi:galactokinase